MYEIRHNYKFNIQQAWSGKKMSFYNFCFVNYAEAAQCTAVVGNLLTTGGRNRLVTEVAGRTHNSSKGTHDVHQYHFLFRGVLEYESDGVPTGERKQGEIWCKIS